MLDQHLQDGEGQPSFIRKRNAFIRNTIESANEATAVSYLSRAPISKPDTGNWITICSMLSHPLSAGSVHITSADPDTHPKIDFGYYTHPLDLEIHARHIQALEKIAKTEPLASYIKPGGRRSPSRHSTDTVDEAKELVRSFATTNYHPCSSCSMGSVVDSRLNVVGVQGLRVVDASVMPLIPRGNIIATVYAVAERAADIISADLGIERCT